jgi:hypothetical protein
LRTCNWSSFCVESDCRLIGTDWIDSLRFCAVTMISADIASGSAWACATEGRLSIVEARKSPEIRAR